MWTKQEDDELRFLRSNGFNINEVGELFMPDRSFSSIEERYNVIDNKKKLTWTDEELLELVRKYKFVTVYRKECESNKTLPNISMIKSRFDGWKNAVKEAGMLRNRGLDPSLPTTLYLVKFIEEGCLKIGLTQMSVELSLQKVLPKYEILFEAKYDYQTAKAKKLEWLKKLAPYKYKPSNFRLDSSPCFKLAPDFTV